MQVTKFASKNVNKVIVLLGEIIVSCSVQSMKLQNSTASAQFNNLPCNAIIFVVLIKRYVRPLSHTLSCANRLPFSNNGWDLWKPARDQNVVLFTTLETNWILWITNPRKGEAHLIVGALFGSTSISDRPRNFARHWLHLTNAKSSPKNTSNRESKRNTSIDYSLNVLKSEPKI